MAPAKKMKKVKKKKKKKKSKKKKSEDDELDLDFEEDISDGEESSFDCRGSQEEEKDGGEEEAEAITMGREKLKPGQGPERGGNS